MYQYWFNYAKAEYGAAMKPPANLTSFMAANQKWIRKKASTADRLGGPSGDRDARFWAGTDLVMAQFDGLVAGFAAYATKDEAALLTPAALYMLNSVSEKLCCCCCNRITCVVVCFLG